jgi:hypothetical protein
MASRFQIGIPSREFFIREIREIRGKIFAELLDIGGAQDKGVTKEKVDDF